MPRTAANNIAWSEESNAYLLREEGNPRSAVSAREDGALQAWLAAWTSCSFDGRSGHLNLLREAREGSAEGYWYAYRRIGKRTTKKYLGPTGRVSIARLEAVAGELAAVPQASAPEGSGAQSRTATRPSAAPARPRQAQPSALLLPKLRVPRPHPTVVPRERLFARLDAGLQGRLIVVTAPAGSGKTTLVSHWVAERTGRGDFPRVAWVSLDPADNDPLRFWRYVVVACQVLRPGLGDGLLDDFPSDAGHRPFAPPRGEALTALINRLSELPGEGLLVLEDYHLITSEQIRESVAFLLEYMPEGLRLLIISRSEPPLPLVRMRARGELHEIGAADLRFSVEETRSFLEEAADISLAEGDALQLDSHVEGWAAGLRLVALALKGQVARSEQETARLLASFTGSHRHLLDYFVSEVLDAPTEPVQSFLLQTSILGRLTGPLCDAVTQRNDSAQVLEALERAGFFLLRLDEGGQWYRYHALFAEAMQQEAYRRLGEGAVRGCYSRASLWYEAHGLPGDAVEAALAAHEFERAVALIEGLTARQMTERHELYTMQRWLDQLPERLLYGSPLLCFLAAETLVFASVADRLPEGVQARVEAMLQKAEVGWQAVGDNARIGEVLAFRALLAVRHGAIDAAAGLAEQSLDALPETEPFRVSRSINLGIMGERERRAGRFEAARRHLEAALRLSEAGENEPGVRVLTIGLADVCYDSGELRRAAELYGRVLRSSGDDLTDRTRALLGLSRISYEWNDLGAAQRQASEALELSSRLGDVPLGAQAKFILARVLHALGHTADSERLLAEVAGQEGPLDRPSLEQEVRGLRLRLDISLGRLPGDAGWGTKGDSAGDDIPNPGPAREALLSARYLLARGDAGQALHLLEGAQQGDLPERRSLVGLELRVVAVLALAALGSGQAAAHALRHVLLLAQGEGYVRIFADEGATMEGLLRGLLRDGAEGPLFAYASMLLRSFSGHVGVAQVSTPATSAEPLSTQELRVLRLFLAGMSREEVAGELVVSVNTVKTHLKHIYRKLGVGSREEAQQTARALRLL